VERKSPNALALGAADEPGRALAALVSSHDATEQIFGEQIEDNSARRRRSPTNPGLISSAVLYPSGGGRAVTGSNPFSRLIDGGRRGARRCNSKLRPVETGCKPARRPEAAALHGSWRANMRERIRLEWTVLQRVRKSIRAARAVLAKVAFLKVEGDSLGQEFGLRICTSNGQLRAIDNSLTPGTRPVAT
jgi:hypothetical protein